MLKCIVVTGGVVSGLGKGTAAAAIARLLKDGKKIVTIKCDGYLNVDPGTMNPVEHGEVFVLEDGGEVDMDFGHYERFLGVNCKSKWNLTSGKIFSRVIANEREGKYLGKTIQIFPHITDEVLAWWKEIVAEEKPDVMLIEIGGTVGDIENSWFVEAARVWKRVVGQENIIYAHMTYVPFLESVGEAKTKPAQRDVALLREKGITPDVLLCRSRSELPERIKEKLSLLCDVERANIIGARDVQTIYELPLLFKKQGLLDMVCTKFNFKPGDLSSWEQLVDNIKHPKREVTVALCGKYTELKDSYASILEAFIHAGAHCGVKVNVKWVETTNDENIESELKGVQGILVPGGFGTRGIEGKIRVIQFAREHSIPYLGICYGLQLAVVEFARNVCKLNANTTEVEAQTEHPVVDYLPEQRSIKSKGATMRLGSCKATLEQGSLVASLYKNTQVSERHRHRYEVNPKYHDILQKHGLKLSGMNGVLAEFIELPSHPYFVATQAHNELTSRLEEPNPLFLGFVRAMDGKL